MLHVLLLLGIYFVLRVGLFRIASLPESAYYEPVIYVAFLKRLADKLYLAIPLLSVVLVFNKRLFVRWTDFESGVRLRNIVWFMVGMLTWRHAFYEYNFLIDRAHVADRLILITLFALSIWRPIFVAFFISAVVVLIGQFQIFGSQSLADSLLPLHIVLVFLAGYVLKLGTRQFSFQHFVFLMGCVIATDYFFSGLGKLNVEWLLFDHVSLVLPGSYGRGWLHFLKPDVIGSATRSLDLLNIPIKLLTLGIELGILFFFWRLKWTRFLLLATFVFHTGIFLTTGICFWFWMLIHAFLLWYVWNPKSIDVDQLFTRPRLLFSLLIIITGGTWSNPVRLAWLEVPMSYSCLMKAETAGGETLFLSPEFFGPYSYNFAFKQLHFLDKEGVQIGVGGPGVTKETFYFFTRDRSDEEIIAFEASTGKSFYDESRKKRFIKTFTQYIAHVNDGAMEQRRYLSLLKPPNLVWQNRGISRLPPNSRIVNVSILSATRYFSFETGLRVVRQEHVLDIPIPQK